MSALGLAVTIAGAWLLSPVIAILVLVVVASLFGAIVVRARQMRRSGPPPPPPVLPPEQARERYRLMRFNLICMAAAPVVLLTATILYTDDKAPIFLMVAGLVLSSLASYPARKATLERLRLQAEGSAPN